MDALAAGDPAPTRSCTLREFLAYFLWLGTFGFGGPIALAGYMQRDLVERRKWISAQDYREGLALSQLSPGPLAAAPAPSSPSSSCDRAPPDIGFLVAGVAGAAVSAAGVFVPPYVVVVLLAPSVRRWSKDARIKAFVNGVTAAAAGAIGGAAWILGRRAIVDLPTAALALLTLLVLVKVRKVPEPLVILAAGGAGLVFGRGGA